MSSGSNRNVRSIAASITSVRVQHVDVKGESNLYLRVQGVPMEAQHRVLMRYDCLPADLTSVNLRLCWSTHSGNGGFSISAVDSAITQLNNANLVQVARGRFSGVSDNPVNVTTIKLDLEMLRPFIVYKKQSSKVQGTVSLVVHSTSCSAVYLHSVLHGRPTLLMVETKQQKNISPFIAFDEKSVLLASKKTYLNVTGLPAFDRHETYVYFKDVPVHATSYSLRLYQMKSETGGFKVCTVRKDLVDKRMVPEAQAGGGHFRGEGVITVRLEKAIILQAMSAGGKKTLGKTAPIGFLVHSQYCGRVYLSSGYRNGPKGPVLFCVTDNNKTVAVNAASTTTDLERSHSDSPNTIHSTLPQQRKFLTAKHIARQVFDPKGKTRAKVFAQQDVLVEIKPLENKRIFQAKVVKKESRAYKNNKMSAHLAVQGVGHNTLVSCLRFENFPMDIYKATLYLFKTREGGSGGFQVGVNKRFDWTALPADVRDGHTFQMSSMVAQVGGARFAKARSGSSGLGQWVFVDLDVSKIKSTYANDNGKTVADITVCVYSKACSEVYFYGAGSIKAPQIVVMRKTTPTGVKVHNKDHMGNRSGSLLRVIHLDGQKQHKKSPKHNNGHHSLQGDSALSLHAMVEPPRPTFNTTLYQRDPLLHPTFRRDFASTVYFLSLFKQYVPFPTDQCVLDLCFSLVHATGASRDAVDLSIYAIALTAGDVSKATCDDSSTCACTLCTFQQARISKTLAYSEKVGHVQQQVAQDDGKRPLTAQLKLNNDTLLSIAKSLPDGQQCHSIVFIVVVDVALDMTLYNITLRGRTGTPQSVQATQMSRLSLESGRTHRIEYLPTCYPARAQKLLFYTLPPLLRPGKPVPPKVSMTLILHMQHWTPATRVSVYLSHLQEREDDCIGSSSSSAMQVSQIENQICIVEIPINLERLVDLLPREGQGNLRDAVGLDAFFVEEKMPKSRRTMSHHYNEIEAKKQHSKLVRGGNLKVSPIVTEGIAHNELSQSPLSPVSRTDDTDLEAVNVELNTPHNPHNLYVRSLLFVLDVQFREDSDPVLRVASCNTAVKPALVIAHEGKP